MFRTTAPLIELVILLYKSCISFTFTKTKYKSVIQKLEISFGFNLALVLKLQDLSYMFLFAISYLVMYNIQCISIYVAKKMKLSTEDFFSKCDQTRSFLRISWHLSKKSLMKNFHFCAVIISPAYYTESVLLEKAIRRI